MLDCHAKPTEIMEKHMRYRPAIFLLLASLATVANAHSGHAASSFAFGLAHPFSGMDHMIAMIAIGLWANQAGGQRQWQLPVLFMFMLATGALCGMFIPALPLIEPAIAVSILISGLCIAKRSALPVPVSLTLIAAFGLIHGYAHGSELPLSIAPLDYASGFLIATAALLLAGVSAGQRLRSRFPELIQTMGLMFAAGGTWMLVNT